MAKPLYNYSGNHRKTLILMYIVEDFNGGRKQRDMQYRKNKKIYFAESHKRRALQELIIGKGSLQLLPHNPCLSFINYEHLSCNEWLR